MLEIKNRRWAIGTRRSSAPEARPTIGGATYGKNGQVPNYPAISLPEAIEKVRPIYKEEVQRRMSRVVAAKHLGYKGLNGASITIISALLKYGLLEGRGDDIRASSGAVAILVDPVGAPDRVQAVRAAAGKPGLFAELQGQFDGQSSAENLQAYLQKQGFIAAAASAAGRAYRDTMELVNAETPAHTPPADKPPKPKGRGGVHGLRRVAARIAQDAHLKGLHRIAQLRWSGDTGCDRQTDSEARNQQG